MSCILVIDDEAPVLESLRYVLQHRGFVVLTATNGVQGVQLACEHGPDVILCDLHMGGADGLLILNAVRHDPRMAGVPFFLMTGWPDSAAERRAREHGADGFLVKPFSTKELYAGIESCLERARAEKSQAQGTVADAPGGRELAGCAAVDEPAR